MGLIKFNGSTDYLKWASLAAALQNVSSGAMTFLAGVKHNSLTNEQGYVNLLSSTGAGIAKAGLSKAPTTDHVYSNAGGGIQDFTTLSMANAQDTLVVMSKATGNVVANASKKVGPGGSWEHGPSDIPRGNQSSSVQLQIGTWRLDPLAMLNGWLAVVAIWGVALTEAQREACGLNWKTSDILTAHPTVKPVFLMEFNVPKEAVTNLGTATVGTFTSVGTTFDTAETFSDWNFDGYGANFLNFS